jgi:hypothetical protein
VIAVLTALVVAGTGVGAAAAAPLAAPAAADAPATMPRYAHLFVIIAENKGYDLIIGPNSAAPNLNALAQHYGLATQFFAETHPSEANYVAMLGGSTFGIHDDDAFYCKPGMSDKWCSNSQAADYVDHTVTAPSLMQQLEARGLTWKAYLESIPEPGSLAVRWPESALPGKPPQLYAAKHNGFISFRYVQDGPARAAKLVGFDVLDRDLATGELPNYAHIVPNQCNDMHGRAAGPEVPQDCASSNPRGLIARGDRVIGELVRRIMATRAWNSRDNFAIVITFDENDKDERDGADQGCCGSEPGSAANSGGGRIPTVVITNHGPRGLRDDTPYNHYSLLRTTEAAFGIGEYLAHAAEEARGVRTMAPLFAVTR